MKKNILIIAPHPDDETLGCGGTILKSVDNGHDAYWAIVTCITTKAGFSAERVQSREAEINKIAALYRFKDTFSLGFPTAQLEDTQRGALISKLAKIIDKVNATDIYLPFFGDVHSDHAVVYEAAISASKSFRHKSVRRLLCYETLSETNFNPAPTGGGYFRQTFMKT